MVDIEKKLNVNSVAITLCAVLFSYTTWSIAKWSDSIEKKITQVEAIEAERAPRLARLESEIVALGRVDDDLKDGLTRMEAKIDRLIELGRNTK